MDTQCGVCSWRPRWLQSFANVTAYVVVYGGLCVFHGILGSYFTGVLTTVEKRFLLPSSISGILMATNDVSSILFSLLITYIGSRGSRPFWMATGVFIMAFSALLIATAEVFPNGVDEVANLASISKRSQTCTSGVNTTENCADADSFMASNRWATALLFCGQFLYGLGKGGFFTLGVTYLDDSIQKDKLPLYLGVTSALRMLGPAVGFMLGSAILKIYHHPNVNPGYGNSDPRWIGAWWLGFVIIGSFEIVFGVLLLLFPRNLAANNNTPDKSTDAQTTSIQKATLKDFLQTVKRTVKNPVIVCQCLSGATGVFALVGFLSFLPKYLEAQFKITASQSSIVVGIAGMGIMLLGLLSSSTVLWRLRPKTLHLTFYVIFVSICSIAGFAVEMMLMCSPQQYTNTIFVDGRPLSTTDCAVNCNCDGLKPSPICLNGRTYLSACFAGCANSSFMNGNLTYSDCSCASSDAQGQLDDKFDMTIGYCSSYCASFVTYIIVFAVHKLLQSTTFVGRNMITMRSVSKEDKSVAMGCISMVFDLMAFIPSPIVFGAAVDSTCIMWGEQCGQRTNCWLYDVDKLRFILHGIGLGCITAQTIFEVGVCYFSRNIVLFDNPPSHPITESLPEKPTKSNDIHMIAYKNSSTVNLVNDN